jgi:hypothetical protein
MILLFGGVLSRLSVEVTTFGERIESLKAGILAAVSFSFPYLGFSLLNRLIFASQVPDLALLPGNFGGRVAIAALSGFLFGVTYRYIVRGDGNPHLRDGAVLAFGLVRGVGASEVSANLAVLAIFGGESLLCFAIARFSLDWALYYNWVKSFNSEQ